MLSILVVDDESMIATALARVFSRAGFRVDTASGGVEAVQKLKSCEYQFLLVDLLMGDMSGEEVLEWTKVHSPKTEVFVMTAYGDTKVRETLLAKGARMILTKPFEDIFAIPNLIQAK